MVQLASCNLLTCYMFTCMLSHKAMSRTIKGHYLVDHTLMIKLLMMLLPERDISVQEESYYHFTIPSNNIELDATEKGDYFVGFASSASESKEHLPNEDLKCP